MAIPSLPLETVNGPLEAPPAGITDAHNHTWIEAVPGGASGAPILNQRDPILAELRDYRLAGGGSIVDCQPGGCGRDGRRMRELSGSSGVPILACTGYHLRKYYPSGYWLFQAGAEKARDYFLAELRESLVETHQQPKPVRAGFLKIACEDSLQNSPVELMEAAAAAAVATESAVQVHTERGADAESIVRTMLDAGLPAGKLVLCHMDKRPDFPLHAELAREGILLEYDTFFRPKYAPEENAWPLLEKMIAAGYSGQVAIGTDIADGSLWARIGGGPGLLGWFEILLPRLAGLGFSHETITALAGGNIIARLARAKPIH